MLANKTGQIFLSSAEQRICLKVGASGSSDVDMLSCGIEKLTSNLGGCSNFSVNDVNHRFGSSIRKLTQQCDFSNAVERWEQSCGSCGNSWKEMEVNLLLDEADSELCRFSVLITSISERIEDEEWVEMLFNCLRRQRIDDGSGAEETAENKRGKSGIRISIMIAGVIFGFLVVLSLSIWIFSRLNNNSGTGGNFYLLKDSRSLKIPIKEVYSATNNLHPSNCIGEGTARKVYKGVLWNNRQAAIKHVINDGETFLREVRSLSHVKYPNLVVLLGCCKKRGECFLVYELCPNGNLGEWLFGREDQVLSWIQRIKIAIDTARGLCFLHTYFQGCIVHRDIKPTNILLGANFEAKLSDFGLSKIMKLGEIHASSEVRGTFGYVDPEYQSNRRVNRLATCTALE